MTARLVYLSPLPWADFAQRPHRFAEWHHAHHGSEVLWLDPYPSRLPQWRDLRRLRGDARPPGQPVPEWLDVVRVPALPLEPLRGSAAVNRLLWKQVLARVATFAGSAGCELTVGKPSRLALEVLRGGRFDRTVYDAMDDFPAFHAGLSARAMAAIERVLAREVDLVLASSHRLCSKFEAFGAHPVLARNACEPQALPQPEEAAVLRERDLVGYVGTLASWFDWDLLVGLARAHPQLRFRLIGPVLGTVPSALPVNVELRPALAHPQAMREMARFALGLIPFQRNLLTDAVDPVKYYEYRALGIPVLATAFGEMPVHAREDSGVTLVTDVAEAARQLPRALAMSGSLEGARAFRLRNTWGTRFAQAGRAVPA